MDYAALINSLVGALGGGGVVGALVVTLVRHSLAKDQAERAALAAQVTRLENEKFKQLSEKVDEHLRLDNPGVVGVQLQTLGGQLEKLSNKIDRMSDDLSGLKSDIENNKNFVQNLYGSVQRLRDGVHRDN